MKNIHKLLSLGVILALLLVSMPAQNARAAGVLYAKPTATGLDDCSSWANACTLKEALTGAVSGEEIWVKEGKHLPGIARNGTFQLKSGVELYGGFDGTEIIRAQRNATANLTILSGDIDNDDSQKPVITDPPDTVTGNTNNSYRVVTASGVDSSAILDGFIITAGYANGLIDIYKSGGGLYNNAGSPTLANVIFSGNFAKTGGGGMYNKSGNPTLTTVAFLHNSVGEYEYGGGMYNISSNPTLTNVTLNDNTAAAGGGIFNESSNSTLTNVTFSGNTATSNGGGVYNDSNSNLTLTNSTFSGNKADIGDGGGTLNNGTLTVIGSTFSGNSADHNGGGIYNDWGTLTVTNSTFFDNKAHYGGGINNSATPGSCTDSPDAIITNSTFSGNRAVEAGGGIFVRGVTTLLFNTITANTSGGGVRSFNNSATCTKVGGNLIADNTGYDVSADGTTQRYYSLGYNLIGVPGANVDFVYEFNAASDQVSVTNPKLGPLADNGGPTKTHALLPGSPAIDKGNNTMCAAAPVGNEDQRGYSRPTDGNVDGTPVCDIGAYEYRVTFGQQTVNSQGKKDGWVREKSEKSSKGGKVNRGSKVLKVGDDASNRQYRSILSFDTSGIPDNAVITRVTLKVKKAGKVGKVSFKKYKGLRVDIRMPKFGSKPALQPKDFQAKASKNYVGKFPAKLKSGWYVTILKSTAFPFINKSGLTQFRLRFKKDDNNDFGVDYLKLYSGNAPGAKRPQLIVEYYIP